MSENVDGSDNSESTRRKGGCVSRTRSKSKDLQELLRINPRRNLLTNYPTRK